MGRIGPHQQWDWFEVGGGREIVEGIGRWVHCDACLVMTRDARVWR